MTDQQMDRNTKESSVRVLRRVVKAVLPFVGVLMVIGAVFFLRELRLQMAVVVGGLLLVEIGGLDNGIGHCTRQNLEHRIWLINMGFWSCNRVLQ